jgi:hypothetical protein
MRNLYSQKCGLLCLRRKCLGLLVGEKSYDFLILTALQLINPLYLKYLRRPTKYSKLSFLQWLRLVDESKGREYKDGSTLFGVKMVSALKDLFFFQHLVLNYPHTAVEELFHRDHEQLPLPIRDFAAAFTLMNDFLSQP